MFSQLAKYNILITFSLPAAYHYRTQRRQTLGSPQDFLQAHQPTFRRGNFGLYPRHII